MMTIVKTTIIAQLQITRGEILEIRFGKIRLISLKILRRLSMSRLYGILPVLRHIMAKIEFFCFAVLGVVGVGVVGAKAELPPELNESLERISALGTFDVTYSLDMYRGDSREPFFSYTNRDLTVLGEGRRLEYGIGDIGAGYVAVLDWSALDSQEKSVASALAISSPGSSYIDYVNPKIGSYFLSELIKNSDSEFIPITVSVGSGLIAYKIANSELEEMVDVWINTNQNYFIVRVDIYSSNTRVHPSSRMEISSLREIEPGLLAPVRGEFSSLSSTSEGLEKRTRSLMAVDLSLSSWRFSKVPRDSFQKDSLERIDREKDGWFYAYASSNTVALVKQGDDFKKRIEASREPISIWLYSFIGLGIILGLIGFFHFSKKQ